MRSKVQFSGGLLPLPDCLRALITIHGPFPEGQLNVLGGACKALNSYHGSPWTDRSIVPRAIRMALSSLVSTVQDSGLAEEKIEELLWEILWWLNLCFKGMFFLSIGRSVGQTLCQLYPTGLGLFSAVKLCEVRIWTCV